VIDDEGLERITVTVRRQDRDLLDGLVQDRSARSVSAAFRLVCDTYRRVQHETEFVDVVRRADNDAILRAAGLSTPTPAPPTEDEPRPRWSALLDTPGDDAGS
jgi:hypothetical protein